MVEKLSFNQQFAERLRIALLKAGHYSRRSTSGVDIHKLAEISNYSPQICRKYLRGQAIPDPAKLTEIAAKLDVSPGWLLFGDTCQKDRITVDKIIINRALLHCLFVKSLSLLNPQFPSFYLVKLLFRIIQEIEQLDVSIEQAQSIIDLALTSFRATLSEPENSASIADNPFNK